VLRLTPFRKLYTALVLSSFGDWLGFLATTALATQLVDSFQGKAYATGGVLVFRLLPAVFTLSELQELYELLLGRRLHKASFRRSLQAARIVEPTDEWRSEGRGRPAQLFRYAPKRRRATPRGVRFE